MRDEPRQRARETIRIDKGKSALKLLVCGSREYEDAAEIDRSIRAVESTEGQVTEIIEGGAAGADELAGRWAEAHLSVPPRVFPAEWRKYGSYRAGPIRNQQMLDEGKPDVVLAFPKEGAANRGTWDMVRRATKAHVRVYVAPID